MTNMTPLEITSMLDESLIGRLAMADAEGRPYIVPLPFYYDGHFLYLRLPLTGRKGEILAQNARVCFEVDVFTDTLDDYCSVLIEGTLQTVHDLGEKAQVKKLNDEKYNRLRRGNRPGHNRSTPLDALPLQRIVIQSITGRRKDTPRPAATSSYEQLASSN